MTAPSRNSFAEPEPAHTSSGGPGSSAPQILLNKEVLASLSIKNDLLALFLLLVRVVFHVGLSVLALYFFNHKQFIVGLLILIPHCAALSFLGWAGIGHEFFHQSVFNNRRLNRILFKAGSVLTWSNYAYFQATHPVHHAATLSEHDLEAMPTPPLSKFQIVLLLSFDLPGFWRRVRVLSLNCAGIVPMAMAGGPTLAADSKAMHRLRDGARVVLSVQCAMLLAFLLLEQYWLILIVTLAPFCFTFPNRVLAIAQHHGLARHSSKNYIDSTRTVLLNPVFAFFYANMNYHVEHHFFPSVPYYRLAKLHRLMPDDYRNKHVVRGCFSLLRVLHRNGYFSRRVTGA